MPTPLFNSETGKVAASKSAESREKNRKTTRWLAKLGLKQAEEEKLFDLLQTAIATPTGTFLAGWFLIDLLDRIGYFNKAPGNAQQASQQAKVQNALLQGGTGGSSILSIFNQLFSGQFYINQALLTNAAKVSTTGTLDADILKAGIFSIAMVQAIGGGQGLNSLLAPILTAAK